MHSTNVSILHEGPCDCYSFHGVRLALIRRHKPQCLMSFNINDKVWHVEAALIKPLAGGTRPYSGRILVTDKEHRVVDKHGDNGGKPSFVAKPRTGLLRPRRHTYVVTMSRRQTKPRRLPGRLPLCGTLGKQTPASRRREDSRRGYLYLARSAPILASQPWPDSVRNS